jgi:hypothetical protein
MPPDDFTTAERAVFRRLAMSERIQRVLDQPPYRSRAAWPHLPFPAAG